MAEELEKTENKENPEEKETGTSAPEEASSDEKKEEKEKIAFELIKAEDKENSVREYQFTVPWEVYNKRMEDMLQDLKKKVVLDGFRKGKAPVRLIKLRFRKEIKQDLINEIVPEVMEQILEDEGRRKFTDPTILDSKVEDGKPVEIKAELEVLPELDLKKDDYTGIEAKVPKEKVTDEAVEKSIRELRERSAVYEPKEGAFEQSDGIVVDVKVIDENGKEIEHFDKKDELMEDPEARLPKQVVEELKGKNKGDSVEVKVPYERKNSKGDVISKTDVWKVDIKEIKKCILPELDDEFAKDMGDFESLEDLKNKIRSNMEEGAENKANSAALDAVMDKIVEKIDVEPPRTMVEYYKQGMISDEARRLQMFGLKLEDVAGNPEEYLQRKEQDALKTVKISLLYRAIVKNENLEITDEEFDKAIEERARAEGRKPLAIRAKLEAENELDSFRDSLMSDKVKNFLIEQNKVEFEEKTPEEMKKDEEKEQKQEEKKED